MTQTLGPSLRPAETKNYKLIRSLEASDAHSSVRKGARPGTTVNYSEEGSLALPHQDG